MDTKAFLEVIEETGHAVENARKIGSIEEELIGYQLKIVEKKAQPVVQANVEHCVYLLNSQVDLEEKNIYFYLNCFQ